MKSREDVLREHTGIYLWFVAMYAATIASALCSTHVETPAVGVIVFVWVIFLGVGASSWIDRVIRQLKKERGEA
jgi:tellurite resistance protein TehA-like permease